MTLSPRLTQERLARLLDKYVVDSQSSPGPDQDAAIAEILLIAVPHLGAQEAPPSLTDRAATAPNNGDIGAASANEPRSPDDQSASAGSSVVPPPNARVYPCADCGKMRSQDEGGTTFTVCEECWDKHWGKERASPDAKVTRLEVIDHRESQPPEVRGRAFTAGQPYGAPLRVELAYQDAGRTLKIFVTDRVAAQATQEETP